MCCVKVFVLDYCKAKNYIYSRYDDDIYISSNTYIDKSIVDFMRLELDRKGFKINYESGVGIRAYGYANGILNKKSCDGYDDYEYNMILDNFVELSKPISASQMKDITDSSFNFRQTMFSISEEAAKKIINYVQNNN